MFPRMSSMLERAPREAEEEEGLCGHEETYASDSESGRITEKSTDAYHGQSAFDLRNLPAWAKGYRRPVIRIPKSLKRVGSFGSGAPRITVGLVLAFILIILLGRSAVTRRENEVPSKAIIPSAGSRPGTWSKPEGFKVFGLIFYGRRVHVDILDCYLQQNLARNGGYLDGVIFLQNTDDKEDVAYLEKLLEREPDYIRLDVGADVRNWKHMWASHFDANTMYFKLDDDLVYIHPDAIPHMVHTLMNHPEAHNVQANIINSASTSWHHYHSGAVRPYLPELTPPQPPVSNQTTWRPSELPAFPLHLAKDEFDFKQEPPFTGHRWLPLEDTSAALMKTPVRGTNNHPWGRDWTSWGIATQHLYSLFNNIEEDTMDRYMFGNGEGIYNTQFDRYKINMMAIWGRTINLMRPRQDDEREFTEEIPLKLGMPVLAQTKAVAAHFSFEPQRAIYQTDLLRRYRAYANERVCAPDNQKEEFPDWLKTLELWGVKGKSGGQAQAQAKAPAPAQAQAKAPAPAQAQTQAKAQA